MDFDQLEKAEDPAIPDDREGRLVLVTIPSIAKFQAHAKRVTSLPSRECLFPAGGACRSNVARGGERRTDLAGLGAKADGVTDDFDFMVLGSKNRHASSQEGVAGRRKTLGPGNFFSFFLFFFLIDFFFLAVTAAALRGRLVLGADGVIPFSLFPISCPFLCVFFFFSPSGVSKGDS